MPCRPCKDDKTILREWALVPSRIIPSPRTGKVPEVRTLGADEVLFCALISSRMAPSSSSGVGFFSSSSAGAASSSSFFLAFSASSWALFMALITLKSTSAITRKLMMAPTKVPRPSTSASVPAASSAARSVMFSASVLRVPKAQASSGVMTLVTSEEVIAPNAPPMMTPMAMSMTLPREMKALNSSMNFFMIDAPLLQKF